MLSFDDPRWTELQGGYGIPFDPRPALMALQGTATSTAAWEELWNELHHQGDVGLASYAAVPHLVRIHRMRKIADWNTYLIVAIIDGCRRHPHRANPPLPSWLADSYPAAIVDLASIGLAEFPAATDPSLIRGVLAILAISKGLQVLGDSVISFDDDELQELLTDRIG